MIKLIKSSQTAEFGMNFWIPKNLFMHISPPPNTHIFIQVTQILKQTHLFGQQSST